MPAQEADCVILFPCSSSESCALLFQLFLFFCLLSFIGFRCSLSLPLISASSSPSPTVRHRQLLSAGVAFRLPETSPRRCCGLRSALVECRLVLFDFSRLPFGRKKEEQSSRRLHSFHFASLFHRRLSFCFFGLCVESATSRWQRPPLSPSTPTRSASSGRSLRLIRVSFSRRTNEPSRLSPRTMTLR